jgi:hypothetical protein
MIRKSKPPSILDYGALAYAEIIQAVIILAATWKDISQSNQNGQFWDKLADIQKSLERIEFTLQMISFNLGKIQNQIALLPAKIRGQIDDSAANLAIGVISASSQRIRRYVDSPNLIDFELDHLNNDISEIQNQIWIIKRAKGVVGLFLTSPMISTWLTAQIIYQKGMKKKNPLYVITSPWNDPFMKDTLIEFKSAYQEFEDTKVFLNDFVIPHFPQYGDEKQILRVDGKNYFTKWVNETGVIKYKYRLTRSSTQSPEILERFVKNNAIGDYWIPINPYDTNLSSFDRQALDAHAQFATDRNESKEFFDCVPDLLDKRDDVVNFFAEPPGIWA